MNFAFVGEVRVEPVFPERDPESPERIAKPDTTNNAILTAASAVPARNPIPGRCNPGEEEGTGDSSTGESPDDASAVVIPILCAARATPGPSP